MTTTKVEPIGEFMSLKDLHEMFHVNESSWIVVKTNRRRWKAFSNTKHWNHSATQVVKSGGFIVRRLDGMSRRNALNIAKKHFAN